MVKKHIHTLSTAAFRRITPITTSFTAAVCVLCLFFITKQYDAIQTSVADIAELKGDMKEVKHRLGIPTADNLTGIIVVIK